MLCCAVLCCAVLCYVVLCCAVLFALCALYLYAAYAVLCTMCGYRLLLQYGRWRAPEHCPGRPGAADSLLRMSQEICVLGTVQSEP